MTDAEAYAAFRDHFEAYCSFKRRDPPPHALTRQAMRELDRITRERRAARPDRGPTRWESMTEEERQEARERYGR